MAKSKNLFWSFFSSVKLTVVLLFLMVLLFIVATFLPPPSDAQEINWFNDLYHSPLFYVLATLFSLNLIICSLNRLPVAVRQLNAPCFPPPAGIFDNQERERIVLSDKDMTEGEAFIKKFLSAKFSSPKKSEWKNGLLFCRERGRFSLFGVYLVHLSVLIIIAGALIGSVFGLEGSMNLREGETSSLIRLDKGRGVHQLPFSVRCDNFSVEFYDTGAPKTYRSDLSFFKNGELKQTGSVLVNHPFTFEGVRFYQASYGKADDNRALIVYNSAGKESAKITAKEGDTFDLPRQKARATVLRVEENIMGLGPAVKLDIDTGKRNIQFWVFQHIDEIARANPDLFAEVPLFNPGLFAPLVFSLERLDNRYFTGLRVVRDPGVPFVLSGGILLLCGLIIIFFTAHERIWLLLERQPEGIKISVTGRASRNQAVLERRLERLCQNLSKELAI